MGIKIVIEKSFFLILTTGMGMIHSSIAFGAESGGGFEFSVGLGGGPTLAELDGAKSNFASGNSQMLLGAALEHGIHIDLLMDAYQARPLESSIDKTGYDLTVSSLGMRVGKRWNRLHAWGDVAIGTLEESYDNEINFEKDMNPASSPSWFVGTGVGYEIIKRQGFSLELYGAARVITRPNDERLTQPISSSMVAQNFGLMFNFFPSAWHTRSTDSIISAYPGDGFFCHHCFYCYDNSIRLLFELGRVAGPYLGESLTRAVFMAFK